jgi:hypothetical protein
MNSVVAGRGGSVEYAMFPSASRSSPSSRRRLNRLAFGGGLSRYRLTCAEHTRVLAELEWRSQAVSCGEARKRGQATFCPQL